MSGRALAAAPALLSGRWFVTGSVFAWRAVLVCAVDDLLTRAVASDQAAFAVLYRDVHRRLLSCARSMVDLDGFRGWSARIVRNRAMDRPLAGARRPAAQLPTASRPGEILDKRA